jgi:hypothetical protein
MNSILHELVTEAQILLDFPNILQEFEGDLKKQAVVLMGLPAAGKSTFISSGLNKWVPGLTNYKVTNSDAQLERLQYLLAKAHWKWLKKNVKSTANKSAWDKFIKETAYKDNQGRERKIPLSLEEFLGLESLGPYYRKAQKAYYSCYFDVRVLASKIDAKLFTDKVKKAGNLLIIDTVAGKAKKILDRLRATKDRGFSNTIVYLDIPAKNTIQRDIFRGETSGRSVGKGVIQGYAKVMGSAFKEYKTDLASKTGVVDRLLHFKWNQTGPRPIDGSYKFVREYRGDLTRKLKAKGMHVRDKEGGAYKRASLKPKK